MESETEASLWRATLGGDGRAFAELFRLHRDRLFRHTARLLESDADADDVTAAAFLELWRRREAVVPIDGSVLPWLFVTATNLARNRRRGLTRYRAVLDRLPRETSRPDPAEEAVIRVGHSRGETALQQALQRLRPADAALLVLVELEGRPITEAAGVVGIAPTAARSRLSRARARLRLEVTEDGRARLGLEDA